MVESSPGSDTNSNRYAPPTAEVRDMLDGSDELTPAGRGTRLLAVILDTFIFGLAVYLPLILSLGAVPLATGAADFGSSRALIGLSVALLGFIIVTYLTIRFVLENGQTIAKRMLGIKVLRSDGSKAALGRIFWLRNVIIGVIGLIPIVNLVISLVDCLMIFGEKRQCLHDRIADTIVVKA